MVDPESSKNLLCVKFVKGLLKWGNLNGSAFMCGIVYGKGKGALVVG